MNQDYRDLLAAFNDYGVEYLVVGAHAMATHGYVRATKDMDVWVRTTPANADNVLRALVDFGAPLQDLTASDLCSPGTIFQIGVEPIRIDLLTMIDGVSFEDAWAHKMENRFADQRAFVLSLNHLIQNKRASGRMQDLVDLNKLIEIRDVMG